jgi:hypothetical protein
VHEPSVSFFYVTPSGSSPESWGVYGYWYTLWCGSNFSGCNAGFQYVVTAIRVNAPSKVAVSTATSRVLVTPAPAFNCNLSLTFGLANYPNALCNSTQPPGITWTLSAVGPAKSKSAQAYLGGQLDMTQLITLTDSAVPLPGATNAPPAPPNFTGALDTCIHYGEDGGHVAVPAGGSATWYSNDSPASRLNPNWLRYSRSDDFQDYFVYKLNDLPNTPAAKQNLWVVIGHAHWGWSGTAVQATPPAQPSPAWFLAVAPTPEASATADSRPGPLPTWQSGYNIGVLPCPPGG